MHSSSVLATIAILALGARSAAVPALPTAIARGPVSDNIGTAAIEVEARDVREDNIGTSGATSSPEIVARDPRLTDIIPAHDEMAPALVARDSAMAANKASCVAQPWYEPSDSPKLTVCQGGVNLKYQILVGVGFANGKGCDSIHQRLNDKIKPYGRGGIDNYFCGDLDDGNTYLQFTSCDNFGGSFTAELHAIYPTVDKFGCPNHFYGNGIVVAPPQ